MLGWVCVWVGGCAGLVVVVEEVEEEEEVERKGQMEVLKMWW